MRSVPEWIGKTDDTPVPPRVRLRVFEKFEGRCQMPKCGLKIRGRDWVCDHATAIINGGANRESNLRPICGPCDRAVKTPTDVAEKSAMYRKRLKVVGIKQRKSRPMPGSRASRVKMKIGGGWEYR